MVLVRIQYEPVSLDVNKLCFEEEQNIPKTHGKSKKVKALLNGVDVGMRRNAHKC